MAEEVALTVLLVEPQVLLRFALALELRVAGFHVIEAANVDEACTLVRVSPEISVVVLGGTEASQARRLGNERSGVKVLPLAPAISPPKVPVLVRQLAS